MPRSVTVLLSLDQNLPDKWLLFNLEVNGKDGFTGKNTGVFDEAGSAP
jgi:hypothetical protein